MYTRLRRTINGFKMACLSAFLAACLAPTFAEAAPIVYDLVAFRWRNDDGGETGATWAAPRDTPALFTNQTIRLRLAISFPDVNPGPPNAFVLRYTDRSDNTGWVIIPPPATATTQAFVMATSPWFSHGNSTTDQLPVADSPFGPGSMVAAPGNVAPIPPIFSNSGVTDRYTNVEFCFRPTSHARLGVLYRFDAGAWAVNRVAPALTLLLPGDVNRDGVVNAADLHQVISNFGRPN